jgi:MFS transporter, DHA2 family, multidrug resistance protein
MAEITSIPQRKSVARAGRKQWIALAVLTLPMMLVLLDNGIIFLALPHMITELRASSTESLWIADTYGFFVTGFMVTIGRLGDRIGHRRLLLIAAAAFAGCSVAAAYSGNPLTLIAIRALLGITGAAIGPCVMSLIKEMFPDPKQMATAFSILATSAMAGVSLGPTLGGFLLGSFWWGSIFLIAVPVMLLLLMLGPFLLPESSSRSRERLDLFSVALSLATILPLIYGLTRLASNGPVWFPLVAIVIGCASGVAFARRQGQLAEPLLDMRLFGIRAIGFTLLMYVLVGIVQSGNGLLLNQHLQLVEGYSAFVTALWMVLPISMAILGVHISTLLAKRFRPGLVVSSGLLIAAVGEIVLTQIPAVRGLAMLMAGLCVVMAGTSPVGVLSSQLVMHAAPPDKSGSAGSLSGTGAELSAALGIAVFGSLATAFYSGHVHVSHPLPSQTAAAANGTLAQAVAAARHLPPAVADPLISAARDTFNGAVTTIAGLSAGLFVLLAALVFLTLRIIPPIGAEPQGAEESD